jgi:hypothetical protein
MTPRIEVNYIEPPTLEEIRARNEEKLRAAKEHLGQRWILHPGNRIEKKRTTEDSYATRFASYARQAS